MATDYIALREENVVGYGTRIPKIGGMLLANRYDKRTHFIFELLQNSEDALGRRKGWSGPREVRFILSEKELRISHYGAPFDAADVRGVCGIDESTKDYTSIGRFGIGFKSVYAFTDRPEVHSGDEAFAIESYVWPVAVQPRARNPEETLIILPLDNATAEDRAEIAQGLEQLGADALLFLRHVEEISWEVAGGSRGLYIRSAAKHLGDHVRQVTLLGEQVGKRDVEQSWLVFSKPALNGDTPVGFAEIAFSLSKGEKSLAVQPVTDAPLVVFFPTALKTDLGFLVQGPYRTTPSRDNVPAHDPWNMSLIEQTGDLLIEALKWFVVKRSLDTNTLECLPLDRAKFTGTLLAPLFEKVVRALKSEALLPSASGDYISASQARLSRTQELRDLIQPDQLARLTASDAPVAWLSGDITADRTPRLRQYLMREFDLVEQTPDSLLLRLPAEFLTSQSDGWIVRLYRFLGNLPAVARHIRARGVPLIRLDDGSHVEVFLHGQPQAFLPSTTATGFPTVRRSVCREADIRTFLRSLGLTEPDPVDDVIRNILPSYKSAREDHTYAADIARILHAFRTDSESQKEKLKAALRITPFVKAVDAGSGAAFLVYPGHVYLAAARLKELFAGAAGVLIVDDSYECLRGEDVRELLEACGATRHLFPTDAPNSLLPHERRALRREAGEERANSEGTVQDYHIRGLQSLLKLLPSLPLADQLKRASLLWEALIELEDRRGRAVFSGAYSWTYYYTRHVAFDSLFIRTLNNTAWIPGPDGKLELPESVPFDSLKWRRSPFIESKINFKKPIVEELAKEVGIDLDVLALLKRHNLTSMAELLSRLDVDDLDIEALSEHSPTTDPVATYSPRTESHNDRAASPASQPFRAGESHVKSESADNGGDNAPTRPANNDNAPDDSVGDEGSGMRGVSGARMNQKGRQRRFVSYVVAEPDEESADPDGLDHQARLALETRAIAIIRAREPLLQLTPAGNPGFDLVESDLAGEPQRWIEVKAMAGCLEDRPVGLSSVQFNFARQHGDQHWLYVVEHAGDAERARIVKIQNPAGRVGTFTFDHGWVSIADIDDQQQGAIALAVE
jgi:hypothetical protein